MTVDPAINVKAVHVQTEDDHHGVVVVGTSPAAQPGPDAVKRASDDRPGDIPAAFDTGAASYDELVDANPGYHAHLRMSAKRMGLPDGGRGLRLLDAGCGTGASTAALLTVAPDAGAG